MQYTYKTHGTCSSQITLDIDGDVVSNVKFVGGCPGNLKAIPLLVEGMKVEDIEKKLLGVRCGMKPTSCADQLAHAVREAKQAYDAQNA